jgi:hypothetical protein
MAAMRNTTPIVISAMPACEREFDGVVDAVVVDGIVEVVVIVAVDVAADPRVAVSEKPCLLSRHC